MASQEYCNYEGANYKEAFWTLDRSYEDHTERQAIKTLLPRAGSRIVEVGAGFGRLASLYKGYKKVILIEPAASMLKQAKLKYGENPKFIFVQASVYNLPIATQAIDTLIMVRVLHHLTDIPGALNELQRVLKPNGYAILEYANKRNLKSILRYASQKQSWNPFEQQPYEFAPLNFDFHPEWMTRQIKNARLKIEAEVGVSHFRAAILKKTFGVYRLLQMDKALLKPGGKLKLSPSIFVKARSMEKPHSNDLNKLFLCPSCHNTDLIETESGLKCMTCQKLWPIEDGIINFMQ